MAARHTISIDAMGGDDAPAMVIEGVAKSLERLAETDFLLVGDEIRLKPLVAKFPALAGVCRIRHANDVVTNEVKPSAALRAGRASSMRLAIDAVAEGEAAGIVSAGNTGALMAMAMFVLKTLPGIDRPAIATCLPTQRGESVMLDLGANVVCDAENLVQFAVMGEVFARNVLGLEKPSVGLLNVGEEDLKGHDEVKRAAAVLQRSGLPIRFHGFVEGDDIGAGTVDVVVTDGFTGNIALKTAEGAAKLFAVTLRSCLRDSLRGRLGAALARPALLAFKRRFDPRRYNGALLLGVNGVCIKSHGGTDALGFANAIRVAANMITHGVNDGIKHDFAQLVAHRRDDPQAVAS